MNTHFLAQDAANEDCAVTPRRDQHAATRVLVVIPTLNEARHITSVLLALLDDAHCSPELAFKIVVVDGGSSDATCALVEAAMREHREIELLHNPSRIQSAAVNLAVRHLGREAEVLIRCDAHAIYPQRYCSKLVETLERNGAHSVVVPLDSLGEGSLQRAIAWLSNSPLGTGGSAHRAGKRSGFVDHGHHAAFRMDFFRQVGGYDEGFTHNEDAEFDCRQCALGARIYLDSAIRVGYHPRASLRELWQQYFKYGAGRSRTVRRHPHSLRLRQLAVPLHLLLSLLALFGSGLSLVFLGWPALYLCVIVAVSLQLGLRHRSWCALLSMCAAPTMHFAWACGFFAGLFSYRERTWQREMAVPLQLNESGSS